MVRVLGLFLSIQHGDFQMETAFPVSPTEADMTLFSQWLAKAAQAIVDSSTMPKTISDLTQRLEAMQADLDRKSLHATELDTQLNEMRQQRDEARANVTTLTQESDFIRRDYERVSIDRDRLRALSEDRQRLLDTQASELRNAQTARDDAEFHALELQEKLDGLKAQMKGFFGLAEPTPEPKPESPVIVPEPNPIPDNPPPAPEPYYSQQHSPSDGDFHF